MAGAGCVEGVAARVCVNTILCNDKNHPIWPKLYEFAASRGLHLTNLLSRCTGGDFLFLVSCTQYVDSAIRGRYKHVLVLHESDLPKGRGWSPVAWQILDGKDTIRVTLLEAVDNIDAGDIWAQEDVYIPNHALADEISTRIWAAKRRLMEKALFTPITPKKQEGLATYYSRRTPLDSRLDPNKTIVEQFNLLRICEPRFPAFFDLNGFRYQVTVRKA